MFRSLLYMIEHTFNLQFPSENTIISIFRCSGCIAVVTSTSFSTTLGTPVSGMFQRWAIPRQQLKAAIKFVHILIGIHKLTINLKNLFHFRETLHLQMNLFSLKEKLLLNVSKFSNKPVRGKLALSFLSWSSDHVRLWCLSSECLGSNLAIAEPCDGDDNIATLTSVSLLATTFGLDRFRVLIGFGFWFIVRGTFHWQSDDVQLWSVCTKAFAEDCTLDIEKRRPPIWLHAWANL